MSHFLTCSLTSYCFHKIENIKSVLCQEGKMRHYLKCDDVFQFALYNIWSAYHLPADKEIMSFKNQQLIMNILCSPSLSQLAENSPSHTEPEKTVEGCSRFKARVLLNDGSHSRRTSSSWRWSIGSIALTLSAAHQLQ